MNTQSTTRSRCRLGLGLILTLAFALPTQAFADEGNEHDTMIGIRKVTIARKIEKRKPQAVGKDVKADGKRVYVHMEFRALEASQVKVRILRGKKAVYTAKLNVGKSPNWRTWVYLTATKSMIGDYAVEISDAKTGIQLKSESFSIRAASDEVTASIQNDDVEGC